MKTNGFFQHSHTGKEKLPSQESHTSECLKKKKRLYIFHKIILDCGRNIIIKSVTKSVFVAI